MADDRIRVGFVGCGGIHAALAETAQVVALADLDKGLAQSRNKELGEAYRAEAYCPRVRASDARTADERETQQAKAAAGELAAGCRTRTYRGNPLWRPRSRAIPPFGECEEVTVWISQGCSAYHLGHPPDKGFAPRGPGFSQIPFNFLA